MIRYLRMTLTASATLFAAAILTFAGCSKDENTPTPPPDDTTHTQDTNSTIRDTIRPVVFVHGFLEAADAYAVATQLFALNGYAANQLHAFDFVNCINDQAPNVAAMATQLQNRVTGVLQGTGADRVDIVAHGVGVQAVQVYLATLGGTAKVAHVIYAGGLIDPSITVSGDITPAPCKYLTLRSDGNDLLQNGNPDAGALNGAKNTQMTGLDNIQLIATSQPVLEMYRFITGKNPTVLYVPPSKVGGSYEIKGRVIGIFDNTPIAGATVIARKIRTLTGGEIQVMANAQVLTSDADGYFSFTDVVGMDQSLEFLVRKAPDYTDMHIYRQQFRANSAVERVRMIPRSGGIPMVQALNAALKTGTHGITLFHSQNQALVSGRDGIQAKRFDPQFNPIGDPVTVTNAQNCPPATAGALTGSTFLLCLLDYDLNGQDGTGPVGTPALNAYGINSFDLFLNATTTGYQTQYVINTTTIGTLNYKSSGTPGTNNSGFNIVQWEYAKP